MRCGLSLRNHAVPPPDLRAGWNDNAGSFDRLAPLLLEAGATCVIALDAAGHGQSGHRSTYLFEDDVADAAAVAAKFAWLKYSIVGHGLGGWVAQGLAAAMVLALDMCTYISYYTCCDKRMRSSFMSFML